MLRLIIVLYGMPISSGSVKLFATAVKLAATETHPQILLEFAARTFQLVHGTRAVRGDRVYVRARSFCIHVVVGYRRFQIPTGLVGGAVEQKSTREQLIIGGLGDLRQLIITKYDHFVLILA